MSDTLWLRLCRGARRLRQRPDWGQLLGADWPERVMALDVTDRFHAKQGRSTGRLVLASDGRRLAVYLKRHYQLPRWRGLLAALWPERGWSPALEEMRHLEWAQAEGLPVPAVVAAGEYLGPWGRLQSFLAVEELAGMLPLHEAIPAAARNLDAADFCRWKATLIAEMARLTRALHARWHFHKDLYLCHFYIPEADTRHLPDWRGRVHLIDLHRLARHRWRNCSILPRSKGSRHAIGCSSGDCTRAMDGGAERLVGCVGRFFSNGGAIGGTTKRRKKSEVKRQNKSHSVFCLLTSVF
jgi:hypothetical protein